MYAASFALKEPPFSITPDPRFVYLGESHREALAHLLYGIGEGGGFVQLTGEVGTGKTTLCRALLEQLPAGVDVALVFNPALTSLELVATVCDELGVRYPAGTTSLKVLVDALHRHLLDAHARGRRTVLVLDEAQALPVEVLEQVRLLTNLETGTAKLLQVILIGQPELIALLDRPRLSPLGQRITARYHLRPLSLAETAQYVRHRVTVAGRPEPGPGGERLFSDAALREVHRLSGGVPRLVNVICDRALLGAYAGDCDRVDAPMVRRGAREVFGRVRAPASRRVPAWAVATGVALVVLALLWVLYPRLVPFVAGRLSPARPVAAVAEVGLHAPPPSRLAEALEDPDVGADRAAALAAVLALWRPGQPAPAAGTLDCRAGGIGGLACLGRTGTWTRLRRYDVPAVLDLAGPDGDSRYAALTRLQADTATLQLGERVITVPLSEIDPLWDGRFTLLWPRPPFGHRVLAPGTSGPEVEWLRARLDALDGAERASGDDRYDEPLKARVLAFQRSRGLRPDGIVGEETMAQLALAARQPGMPSLLRGRAR